MMNIPLQNAAFERLGHRLEQLMEGRVGVVCSGITAGARELYPEELVAVGHAVPKRQREFATGRVNARRAMSRIGEPAAPIPSGADRAPVWPAHLTGSISHTDDACVAVVARRSNAASLGIDLEHNHSLPADLWPVICTPAEASDIYLRAAEVLGVKPENCLVVEDNQNGIRAAEAAGCPLLVVQSVHDVQLDRILDAIHREGGLAA